MYSKIYKVNGQDDVDDYFVMENNTYFKYSGLIIKEYLTKNNFNILNTTKDLENSFTMIEQFVEKKRDLYFTNSFKVDIQVMELNLKNHMLLTKHHFFNDKNQLCATTNCKLIFSN